MAAYTPKTLQDKLNLQQQLKGFMTLHAAEEDVAAGAMTAATAIQATTAAQRVSTVSLTQLSTTFRQLTTATALAAAAAGSMLLSFTKSFSPGSWSIFELRIKDFAAVMGEILHPTFLKLSNSVKTFSDFMLNLSPRTKELINSVATFLTPLILLTTTFSIFTSVVTSAWTGIRGLINLFKVVTGLSGRFGTGVGGVSASSIMNVTAGVVNVNGTVGGSVAAAGAGVAEGAAAATGGSMLMRAGSWMLRGAGILLKWVGIVGLIWTAGELIYAGAKWLFGSAKKTEDAAKRSSEGRNADRMVKSFDSVLQAGDFMREESLRLTSNKPVADLIADSDAERAESRQSARSSGSGRQRSMELGVIGQVFGGGSGNALGQMIGNLWNQQTPYKDPTYEEVTQGSGSGTDILITLQQIAQLLQYNNANQRIR